MHNTSARDLRGWQDVSLTAELGRAHSCDQASWPHPSEPGECAFDVEGWEELMVDGNAMALDIVLGPCDRLARVHELVLENRAAEGAPTDCCGSGSD